MQVRKQQLQPDIEQVTVSNQNCWTSRARFMDVWTLGMEYYKAVYHHPAYLTYMQSTSCEIPGWMNHKLESRLSGEISIISDMQRTPPSWQKAKRVLKLKEWSEKAGLKLNIQKTKILASGPIISWQIDGWTKEIVTDFIFGATKSLQTVTAAMKLKDVCFLEEKQWQT